MQQRHSPCADTCSHSFVFKSDPSITREVPLSQEIRHVLRKVPTALDLPSASCDKGSGNPRYIRDCSLQVWFLEPRHTDTPV